MAERRPAFEFDSIPLGAKIRQSIKKEKTYRVLNGVQIKMDYYTPTNPQTDTQQAWRSIFADAISAWQSLSTDQQNQWRDFVLD